MEQVWGKMEMEMKLNAKYEANSTVEIAVSKIKGIDPDKSWQGKNKNGGWDPPERF